MDINLNNIKSASDFENKLNQIAEAFDGNYIIKTRGNDTLSVQKSSFFGRLWQWLQGRSAQERKVDDVISGFLLQNKGHFYNVLNRSENPSTRRYHKFIKKEMVDRLDENPILINSGRETIKANAVFFSRIPYFSNRARAEIERQKEIEKKEETVKQEPIRLDGFSDQVIDHLIESTYGLKNLEDLPKDKWVEFYVLADYLGMTSLADEMIEHLSKEIKGPQRAAFAPVFIDFLITIPQANRYSEQHIFKLFNVLDLDLDNSQFLKGSFLEACAKVILNLEPQYREEPSVKYVFGMACHSVETIRESANKGFAPAQSQYGGSILGSPEKALEWYEKAANQGFPRAQFELAVCYERGYGIKKDDKKAFEWYKKAADQGYHRAQYNLGKRYEAIWRRLGVKEDYEKALEWYKKAADQGNYDAKMYRDGLMFNQVL